MIYGGYSVFRLLEILMNMTMNKKAWLLFSNQVIVASEPFMARIFLVMNKSGRRMGGNHIELLEPPEFKPETSNKNPHFLLMVLILIAIVPAGTGESKKALSSV